MATTTIHEDLPVTARLFIEAGNTLTTNGHKFRCGHEPVHSSKSGQCVEIDSDKNTWFCRSCQRGGGAVTACMSLHGLAYQEALAHLHKRFPDEAFGSDGSSSSQVYGENQPWPEPGELPGGLSPVPALVEEMLPEPLRPWLTDISQRMQCPLEFPTIGALTAEASLVGRRLGIRPKMRDDWLVVPNMWGAAIGRPGILKTPALAEAMKPLYRLEMQARAAYEEALTGWEFSKLVSKAQRNNIEQKIREAISAGHDPETIKSSAPVLEAEPVPVRYVVNDSTVEKLGVTLNQNPNGVLLFRDELVGWLRTLDREGHENDRAFYLEAWNGNGAYTYDRIGRGTLHIKAACVSILGGIQPGPLAEYLRATIRGGSGDDGLMQRFQLAVYPDEPGSWQNIDRWPDTHAKNHVFHLFAQFAVLDPLAIGATFPEGDDIPFLRFAPDAQGLFDEWRTDLEHKIRSREDHPAIEAHLAKYRRLMPSLALLFHLLEIVSGSATGPVSFHAAEMAAAWCDFLEAHARRIYQGITQHALFSARQLAARIQAKCLPNPFTLREVYRNQWSGLHSPEDVREAVEILEDLNWIRSEKLLTPGRPRFQYTINPHLHGKEQAA